MEAYPDGSGLFRGKNFVYDPRIAVGSDAAAPPVGACMCCRAACEDYGAQIRCVQCRVLVLVCAACTSKEGFDAETRLALRCDECLERA